MKVMNILYAIQPGKIKNRAHLIKNTLTGVWSDFTTNDDKGGDFISLCKYLHKIIYKRCT